MSLIKLLFIFSIFSSILSCSAVKKETSVKQIPSSDFSHLMPIIDSVAFNIMRQDSFLTNIFSFATNDTMKMTPPVYSLYLWGKNHFLHFSPNKGFFWEQLGTAYLIFQSKKPGVGHELKQAWQMNTGDSLISYDFKGPDFVLTEIIAARHVWTRKNAANDLIPMLSSYSAETYKKLGLPDTAESSMGDFIKTVDKNIQNKLFDKIQSVEVIVNKVELELVRSMLLMNGYKQNLNTFLKSGEPTINYRVDEGFRKSKVQRINILLSDETPQKVIDLGKSGKITFSGKQASFVFN